MKKYSIVIEGVTPYMQHRMDDIKLDEWEKKRGPIIERPEIAQQDLVRAEFHCYRNGTGHCYIPSEHIKGALIEAGGFLKSKVGNSRKSMKNIVAGMFFISPERIEIPDFDTIDKRSAVNRNVKGRVIVVRPRWEEWKVEFDLIVDNNSITDETVKELFNYAGNYVGIGSFRPTNNGMFGRFKLLNFEKYNI